MINLNVSSSGRVLAGLVLLLGGCDAIIDPMADYHAPAGIEADRMTAVRAASQTPPDLRPGDMFVFDNPNVTWQVVSVAENGNIAWQADNGETQITAPNPLLPALEWHSEERGSGRRLISNISGAMFPLESGNELTFRSTVDTDRPPYAWEFDWTCETGDLETVAVPAGTFPAYRIACGRQQPEEVIFYYAPEVGNYVRLIATDSNGGPPQERRLTDFTRASMPMQRAGMPAPAQGEVVLESEEPDRMGLTQGQIQEQGGDTMSSNPQPTTRSGPTALGMIAESEGSKSMAPAPTEAPQSGLMAPQSTDQAQSGAQSAVAAATAETGVSPGTIAVHLASYKEPGNAESGWKQLMASNRDQLQDTRPLIRKVEIAGKGVFYRLHAGPVASEAQGREICRVLAQRGTYCKVVKL